jgi:hypothetical protein
MTWIEVASDAIKIGLGALISLISTLVITKRNIDSEAQKLYLIQKREKLDKCLAILNVFHKAYAHYRADVDNYSIMKEYNQIIDKSVIENLKIKFESFRVAFEGFVDLEGYILAVGDLNAHTKLFKYMEVVDNARDRLWHENNNIIKTDEIASLNTEVRKARQELFSAINKSYDPKK